MLTITIDPIVLEKLQECFPKPKTSAEKALQKYKTLLEELLFKVLQRGRSNYELLFDLYSLPVSKLTHEGPHIGPLKVRLHKWLHENNLSLVENVEPGSNLSGLVSLVKFTELVSLNSVSNDLAQKITAASSSDELSAALSGDTQKNQMIFSALFPDYYSYLSSKEWAAVFDIVPIDILSLEAYVVWLNTKATMISPGRVRTYTEQALLILSIAKHTGGFYPQRRKESPFGRTYYQGISVQNVNKDLRRAMLGNSWEYDIRSSVVTWKMAFAQELTDQLYPTKECQKMFWASWLYLDGRKEFMRDVRYETFGSKVNLTLEYQDGLIKEAVTAISFGARANLNGWRTQDGAWTNPALVNVLKNTAQRNAFLNSHTIQQFIKEQVLLDAYLAKGLESELPEVYYGPLITRNIKPSKSKAVAYMYQKSETNVMDVAYRVLDKHGIKPIARIHDAFVVRNKLPIDLRSEIMLEMRDSTHNSHWKIKQNKLEGFSHLSPISEVQK